MAYHSNGYSGDERDLDRDDRNNDYGDKPTYLMEHLATFTVTQETGIIFPKDGMRRLLQLEKSNGIWSQKMQLCLDRSWVLIMDYETGNVMERFPGKSIQEPTAFASQDPTEMYNNILVFIVTNSNPAHPPEMHIFQCESISAHDLVEDLKQMQTGKTLTRSRKSSVPPPTMKPSPQRVINNSREYRESDSEVTNNDDNSSTTSEQYERDVTVLNHCFDDIEKFIARLQHAAAASRELERRRRSRKSKKRDNGDGMLTMRTKPPHEKEFFDIFQKFKLSFNLLAKLKAHIHDPNAPELVHFLFTPLALIVEAAHDTYFDLQLPRKVHSPLLTREAINLLINCVTSKETELWHSLGNAWLIPRDEWKGHVSSYHPVFLDKWSPDYPVVDELETENKHYPEHNEPYSSDYNDYEPSTQEYLYDRNPELQHRDVMEPKIDPDRDLDHMDRERDRRDISVRSDISADSIERNGGDERSFKRIQENWFDLLNKKNAHIVEVTYPRTANNEKELTVVRGEYLEILDDSRKWWKARNHKGEIAHVPHTIVKKINYLPSSPDIYNNPLYTQYRNRDSERYNEGQSPGNPQEHASNGPSIPAGRLANVPAPPPPPPPGPTPILVRPNLNTELKQTPKLNRSNSVKSMSHIEELNQILPMLQQKRHDLDIKTTPEVFIDQKSTPIDVQNWLKIKEFTEDVRKKFDGFTGHQLLQLTRAQSKLICGPSEGQRLYSQLSVQKNMCNFQTVRSSELRAILLKAREKAEAEGEDDN